MTGSVEDFLSKWVVNSGRAMELRVAREFLRADASVRQSYRYRDPAEPDTIRECDVVADYRWSWGDAPCVLTVCVEVKSSTEHPWVAFRNINGRGPAGPPRIFDWITYFGGPNQAVVDSVFGLFIGSEPFSSVETATHIVAAGVTEKGNQIEPAYAALRQVQSATEALYRESANLPQSPVPHVYATIGLVVTAAPLFTCELDGAGETVFRRVSRVDLSGHDRGGGFQRVYVCTEEAVASFAGELRSLTNRVQVVAPLRS